jgi:hypothetical protein
LYVFAFCRKVFYHFFLEIFVRPGWLRGCIPEEILLGSLSLLPTNQNACSRLSPYRIMKGALRSNSFTNIRTFLPPSGLEIATAGKEYLRRINRRPFWNCSRHVHPHQASAFPNRPTSGQRVRTAHDISFNSSVQHSIRESNMICDRFCSLSCPCWSNSACDL